MQIFCDPCKCHVACHSFSVYVLFRYESTCEMDNCDMCLNEEVVITFWMKCVHVKYKSNHKIYYFCIILLLNNRTE